MEMRQTAYSTALFSSVRYQIYRANSPRELKFNTKFRWICDIVSLDWSRTWIFISKITEWMLSLRKLCLMWNLSRAPKAPLVFRPSYFIIYTISVQREEELLVFRTFWACLIPFTWNTSFLQNEIWAAKRVVRWHFDKINPANRFFILKHFRNCDQMISIPLRGILRVRS